MTLTNTNVLITGAGRGLGAALARVLAARGARLVLVARSEEVELVAQELRSAGAVVHAIRADIAEKNSIYPLVGTAAALIGPIDVLINNAGSLGVESLSLLQDTDCEALERALAVNVVGAFRLTKALVASMALRGRGVVVHVSTDAAVNAYPEWGVYGVSKAAVDHLSRSWAVELGAHGVRVFAVDPGEMDTVMHAQAVPSADRSELARPEDVAQKVVRLIESEALAPNGSRVIAAEVSL